MSPPQQKPTVIITGASGLLGAAITRALCHDYQVVGFDIKGNPKAPPEAENVCVDLTDTESVQLGLERVKHAYGKRIASVIHLAAYYDFSGEPSPLYDEITVRGTERMLDGLQDFEVGQFLFSSTMLVHEGTEPGKPIDEDSPLAPRWDYPQSKVDTEKAIHDKRGKIPAVMLRIAGAYTDDCNSIPISQQIIRIAERRLTSKVYPGDTSRGQAFIHLDDLVNAVRLCVEKRTELSDECPILIGEPETYSYDRLQRTIAKLIHDEEDWETQLIPKSMAKTGAWVQDEIPGIEEPFIKPWMVDMADDHYELDISRARELLGWEPRHRLIDTLPKMVDALKDDPKGWYERHGEDPAQAEELAGAMA